MIKAAIAGCGGIFPMHAASLKAVGVEVTAVCDIISERAERRAGELGCGWYTDYKAMVDKGGFDVLHICLPHYLHAPAAVYAAEKGFNVLTEKPMATSVADAEKMIAASQKNNTCLGVIFQNRYNPASRLIKDVLDSGRLGAVRSGWLRVTWYRSAAYYTDSGWRGKWATEGGGVLINQSIHTFDLMNHFLGGAPDYVEAAIANRRHPEIEVEDVAEGVIAYGNNVFVSFYASTIFPYDAPVALELVCENGTASLIGDQAVVEYGDGRKETAQRDEGAAAYFDQQKDYWGVSHILQIRAFYKALKTGRKPDIGGEEGIKTQKLINAIYQSAKTGERVPLKG